MRLYEKLKDLKIIETKKEFSELLHVRAVWVNDKPIDDPNIDVEENDKIKVGISYIN